MNQWPKLRVIFRISFLFKLTLVFNLEYLKLFLKFEFDGEFTEIFKIEDKGQF